MQGIKLRWPTNQKSKKRSLWSEIIFPGTASQKLGQSQPLRQSHQGPSPTIPMRLTKFFAQILQRIARSFQTRIRQVSPRGFFLRLSTTSAQNWKHGTSLKTCEIDIFVPNLTEPTNLFTPWSGSKCCSIFLCSGKRQLKTQACWEKATHGYSTPLKPVRRLFLWNASMEHVAATLLWHTFFGQSWILKGAKRSKSMGVPVSLYFYQPTTITSTVSFPLSNKHILSYFCIPYSSTKKWVCLRIQYPKYRD
jgi:hypothetical protein